MDRLLSEIQNDIERYYPDTTDPVEVYGYMRVSSKGQTLKRQLKGMKVWSERMKVPIKHIYQEKVSGYKVDRPEYQELKDRVMKREPIVVLATAMDRLGRDDGEGVSLMNLMSESPASLVTIDDNAFLRPSPSYENLFFCKFLSLLAYQNGLSGMRTMKQGYDDYLEAQLMGLLPEGANPVGAQRRKFNKGQIQSITESLGRKDPPTFKQMAETFNIPGSTFIRMFDRESADHNWKYPYVRKKRKRRKRE